MLSQTANINAAAEPTCSRNAVSVQLPRLCSIKRACVEWGDCGKTRFYEIVREHGVELLKIGSKTVVTGDDVNRVADAILTVARKATIDARALATKSVAARRQRRTTTVAPKFVVARRRRRGDSPA